MDLFLSAVETALLREATRSPLGMDQRERQRASDARMALEPHPLVGAETQQLIARAFAEKDEATAQQYMAEAYWSHVAPVVPFAPTEHCLLLNPPRGLRTLETSSYVSMKTQPWAAEYGYVTASLLDPIVRQAAGMSGHAFTDVKIFDHEGIREADWMCCVFPGTTITVHFPAIAHLPWLRFFGLRPYEPRATDEMTFHELFSDDQNPTLASLVYGTESR